TNPGETWALGVFHSRIGTAVPSDCVSCHYPLMADGAQSDLTNATNYSMKHRSTQLGFQRCDTCHSAALANAIRAPTASTLCQTGALHGSLTAQPTACVECHLVSEPGTLTQSSWTYAMALGGTPSNAGQWLSHGSASVAGRDCSTCHLTDAQQTGSMWK